MADDKHWKGGRLGPFHLGRRYKDVKTVLGADGGRLYEAHNVHTGTAGLVLLPGPNADWAPEEHWQVRASSQASPPYLALEVEQAPAAGRLPALAEMLDLLTSAVERMETSPEARVHLTREPVSRLTRWSGRGRRWLRSRPNLALVALATMGLGVALWLGWPPGPHAPMPQERPTQGVAAEALSQEQASGLINTAPPDALGIAYPMPEKPFSNQAKAPCRPEVDEVEINGGCWVEVARRPPCLQKVQAEYKGKCYMPAAARPQAPTHSLQP